MSYCTRADIQELMAERVIVQLSNDDPRATEANWDNVDAAIRFADNTINGYLRGRYSLPLNSFDELVTAWATFIARWWLYNRRPDGKDLPTAVTLTYGDATKSLKLVQEGKLHLGVGDGIGNAGTTGGTSTGGIVNGELQPEAGQIRIRSGERMFSSDRLKQF